jgi:Ca2+-binding EF-hand superfamily protein
MSRDEFIAFSRGATSDKSSPEYAQLYQFLLDCFRSADSDYDGKVSVEEFDMMVELAARDVRRLGLAPTHKQTYKTSGERLAARKKLFQAMDADRSGFIGFDEWLQYSLKHIAEKVTQAPTERNPSMRGNKEEFLRFAAAATQSRASAEYKEFYNFLLECFVEADEDMDGKVNLVEFDKMVEKAGAFPRSHGLAPSTAELFKTDGERLEGRRKHFEAMDADKSGYISFEEWLEFTYAHVSAKVQQLGGHSNPQ